MAVVRLSYGGPLGRDSLPLACRLNPHMHKQQALQVYGYGVPFLQRRTYSWKQGKELGSTPCRASVSQAMPG